MKKRLKRGSKVVCLVDIPNFTQGKAYKVLGNAPKNQLIIKGDNGKRNFPLRFHFKKVTLIMKLKHFIYGRY